MATDIRRSSGERPFKSSALPRYKNLPKRRHPDQGRPHEHGNIVGSAGADAGSSVCRVGGFVARGMEVSWWHAKADSQEARGTGRYSNGGSPSEKAGLPVAARR